MALTHLDEHGRAQIVDISNKAATVREAVATARVLLAPATLALLRDGAPKGDVMAVARIAGIQAAKKTSELIPLCHPLALTSVEVHFEVLEEAVVVRATARCTGPTGVEMEAMCAASTAALTLYDMLKAVERGITIEHVRLERKSGGRSGEWLRGNEI
ncbi:MAG: cyclic pyranopterin phosphate synthase [Polyangiales bacterium]|jgi:cyclic pyranopterin phosphate synthase